MTPFKLVRQTIAFETADGTRPLHVIGNLPVPGIVDWRPGYHCVCGSTRYALARIPRKDENGKTSDRDPLAGICCMACYEHTPGTILFGEMDYADMTCRVYDVEVPGPTRLDRLGIGSSAGGYARMDDVIPYGVDYFDAEAFDAKSWIPHPVEPWTGFLPKPPKPPKGQRRPSRRSKAVGRTFDGWLPENRMDSNRE